MSLIPHFLIMVLIFLLLVSYQLKKDLRWSKVGKADWTPHTRALFHCPDYPKAFYLFLFVLFQRLNVHDLLSSLDSNFIFINILLSPIFLIYYYVSVLFYWYYHFNFIDIQNNGFHYNIFVHIQYYILIVHSGFPPFSAVLVPLNSSLLLSCSIYM